MSVNIPVRNGQLVGHVSSAIHHGTESLDVIPKLLRQLLAQEAWREFTTPLGESVTHARFAEFVATPPLAGLGTEMALIRSLVAADPVTLDLLDQALAIKPGQHRADSNITSRKGTTRDQALRRLRKDRPDLHARVLAKELSPHRAMIEAGFRPRTATVPIDDPERLAATLRRRLDSNALARLQELLQSS